MTYCELVASRPDSVHRPYHDTEYGFPITPAICGSIGECERRLFERLMLEINQAGLSWELILKRKDGFSKAYSGWDPGKVARYEASDVERLLADASIIRNRAKIQAAIANAQAVLDLPGGLHGWLTQNHPLDISDWVKLFRKTFKFCGYEVVKEFLMSTGYLPGAHDTSCPIFDEIATLKPRWMI